MHISRTEGTTAGMSMLTQQFCVITCPKLTMFDWYVYFVTYELVSIYV